MHSINRRTFLLTGAAAGACLCTGCATLSKRGDTPSLDAEAYTIQADGSVAVDLERAIQLNEVGGSVKIRDKRLPQPIIIARTGENEYVVRAIQCTHRGVEVEYQPEQRRFKCASLGGSTYALDGTNLSGPAKAPLAKYPTSVQSNRLAIKPA